MLATSRLGALGPQLRRAAGIGARWHGQRPARPPIRKEIVPSPCFRLRQQVSCTALIGFCGRPARHASDGMRVIRHRPHFLLRPPPHGGRKDRFWLKGFSRGVGEQWRTPAFHSTCIRRARQPPLPGQPGAAQLLLRGLADRSMRDRGKHGTAVEVMWCRRWWSPMAGHQWVTTLRGGGSSATDMMD